MCHIYELSYTFLMDFAWQLLSLLFDLLLLARVTVK